MSAKTKSLIKMTAVIIVLLMVLMEFSIVVIPLLVPYKFWLVVIAFALVLISN